MSQRLSDQAEERLDQFKAEIKSDKDDEFLAEKEQHALSQQTILKQKRENIIARHELIEQQIRQKWDGELRSEREKSEVYHKMDVDQVKIVA